MNKIDCLRLKRNFAWWLFTASHTDIVDFGKSGLAVVEHHFNNHEFCGEWCPHKKNKDDIERLTKYRSKTSTKPLYDKCMEILLKFLTPG